MQSRIRRYKTDVSIIINWFNKLIFSCKIIVYVLSLQILQCAFFLSLYGIRVVVVIWRVNREFFCDFADTLDSLCLSAKSFFSVSCFPGCLAIGFLSLDLNHLRSWVMAFGSKFSFADMQNPFFNFYSFNFFKNWMMKYKTF